MEHTRDEHCSIDPETDSCTECGVEHGEPCVDCGGRAFHKGGCVHTFERPAHVPEDMFPVVCSLIIPLEKLWRLHDAGTARGDETATDLDLEMVQEGYFEVDPVDNYIVRTEATELHYRMQLALRNIMGAQAWTATPFRKEVCQ